jgi:tRNA G26 N,N-dimethylase Trm1
MKSNVIVIMSGEKLLDKISGVGLRTIYILGELVKSAVINSIYRR